jgi:tetratricopeptide (TPR) repeat protein
LKRPAVLGLLLLSASAPLWPADAEERGDRAFRHRAAGFLERGTPMSEPTETAIAAYGEALARDPDNLRLHGKLTDALCFQGRYLAADQRLRRGIYERLLELAQRAVDLAAERTGRAGTLAKLAPEEQAELLRAVPGAAEAHFWAAAAWGFWGTTHGPLAAARNGVLSKVRHHARITILLDERYNDAGGLRILGRLHTRAPWVPFLSGWIDRREGIALLRRAVAISRRDPENLLFLAEALLAHDKARRGEALELLRELGRRRPNPDELVEDSVVLEQARKLLAELAARG